ncbi:hypothetical protein AXF42_Ash021630 [Apostasia shenzhenica]|uniref:Uncharacterized protein n=1 Tax=Apostasia shenzhenica TaxID=1088818 RepID=A0A2H9ZTX3_9ASPA|nr:hypothetical protein AXF42_Ash021630 [Apostasia shenzhenica]
MKKLDMLFLMTINFIPQQDWNLFVNYHISEEFEDELATQATQGTIHPKGKSDLFALAYEEPEHPERVRVEKNFR